MGFAIATAAKATKSILFRKMPIFNSDKGRSSDTMGMKHFVRFGLYKIKGSINVQLAGKTGFAWTERWTLAEEYCPSLQLWRNQ